MPRTSLHRVWQARALGFAALAATALIVTVLAVTNTNAAPTVTTDKADYHPSDTVIITGGGYAPNTFYDVPVVRPDGSVVKGDGTLTLGWDSVFTNGSGAFTYNYKLDGVLGTYQVKVYPYGWNGNFSEAPLASTTFTDSPLITDFRQCSNKNPTLGDCVWISSIVQSSNSSYRESMATPQRLVFDNITTQPSDIHTLSFSHQTTKAGTHAYDWLVSYEQAIAGAAATPDLAYTNVVAGNFTNAEACDATIGPPGTLGATCLSLRSGPNSFVVPIPDDTYLSKDGSTLARILAYEGVYGNRTIKIYGNSPITAASISAPAHSPAAPAADTGDSDASYTLTWTSTSTQVLIEMAGHLAVTGTAIPWGWGPLLGASQISGGPYHFKLDMHDGSSLGSQDNQIKGADIQIVKGQINIVKDAVPNNAQNFGFTCTGTTPLTFSLDDDADGTLPNTQTFMSLDPGTYTCSEDTLPAGWSLTSLVCSDPDSGSSVNLGTRTATIDVDAGETITCTFTDTGAGTITIIKDAVPNDAQDFSFSGTCFTAFSLDDDADGTLSNIKGPESHSPGSCTVIEDAPPSPPWNLTGLACVDPDSGTTTNLGTRTATIDLDAGEGVTCTFTNTKDGTIKITKDAIPNDPQNFSFSGDLGVFTLDDDSDGTLSNMFGPVTKTPGSYMVIEGAVANWTLTGISCSGDLDAGNVDDLANRKVTIDLDPGENQICTFTNAQGALKIVKDSDPDDPQDFSYSGGLGAFSLDDDADGTLSNTFSSNSPPGSYAVTEAAVVGWDLTSIICVGDTDGGSVVNLGARTVTIDLDAGESIMCTFKNTKRGTIIVEKQTNPDGAAGSFTFTGTAAGTISDNGTITVGNLVPGTYSSTENNPAPAFDLTSLVCDDGASATPSSGNVGTRTATFQVDPGETVKCTFTNTQRGKIIVEKQTVPDGAAGSFTFTGNAAGTISDNGTIMVADLVPGTYSSTENDPTPAFVLTSIVCDDGASATPSTVSLGTRTATFKVDPGETVKCTFTNTKQPTLTVNKVTIPASDAGQFNLRIDGTAHASCVGNGGTTGSVIVSIGGHIVDETACVGTNLGNYSTAISGDCASGGTVTLAAGDNKTCTITNTRNGTIKIIKDAVPDDLIQDFSFTCSPGLGTFTLDDDTDLTFSNMETFTNVTPGPYTCNENGPPGGWVLTGLSCSDPDGGTTTNLGTATASIDLDPGETVTCTFTDTKKGTIIVEKQTIPNAAPGSFTFTGDVAGTISDNGTLMSSVAPGTYMSTENDPTPAYDLTSIVCDDSNSSGNLGLRKATFVVEAGETVKCTFTNTQRGTIKITKDAVPDDAQDFSFTGTCFAAFSLDDDADGTLSNMKGPELHALGSCTVIEGAPAAPWALASIICSDPDSGSTTNLGTRTATIDLDAGENVTCTFTNEKQAMITIIKDSQPDDPQDFSFSGTCFSAFSLDDDADGALSNTKTATHAAGACTVIENGPVVGWALFNIQCVDPSGGTTISVATRTASIDLAVGETVSCTFTNVKQAKLTVCKDVVPNDSTLWDFQLAGPSPGTKDDLADGACHTFNNLAPGNYTLSETFQLGYQPSVDCGAGSVGGNSIAVTLASGQTVTCTFTNTFRPGPPAVGGIAGLVERPDATPAEDANRPIRGEIGAIIFVGGLIGTGAWFIRRRALA